MKNSKLSLHRPPLFFSSPCQSLSHSYMETVEITFIETRKEKKERMMLRRQRSIKRGSSLISQICQKTQEEFQIHSTLCRSITFNFQLFAPSSFLFALSHINVSGKFWYYAETRTQNINILPSREHSTLAGWRRTKNMSMDMWMWDEIWFRASKTTTRKWENNKHTPAVTVPSTLLLLQFPV